MNLRPTNPVLRDAVPELEALRMILAAVEKRRLLIYGELDRDGYRCALGCLVADNPDTVLTEGLVNEVARINDSLPKNASCKARWKKVRNWIKAKIKELERAKKASSHE